jgi:uncharacterized protein (DUF1330 family)
MAAHCFFDILSGLEQAHRWYDSPEYRPLRQLRLEGTRGNAVLIEGR